MLTFIGIAVLFASAQGKYYSDCGSKYGTVSSVSVSGCADDAKECVLKRNTNASISIDFTPASAVSTLEAEVHGVVMNLPVPFPLPQPDACRDSGLSCPLQAGQKASYKTTLPILKSYPKVKVDVKWELKSDQGDLVCVIIPAKIN